MSQRPFDFFPIAARLAEFSFAASEAESIVYSFFQVWRDTLGLDLRAECRADAARKTQAYLNTRRTSRRHKRQEEPAP